MLSIYRDFFYIKCFIFNWQYLIDLIWILYIIRLLVLIFSILNNHYLFSLLESNLESLFSYVYMNSNNGGRPGNDWNNWNHWNFGHGGAPNPHNPGPSNSYILSTGHQSSDDSKPIGSSIFWLEDRPRRLELADSFEEIYTNRAPREYMNLGSSKVNLNNEDLDIISRHLTWNHIGSPSHGQLLRKSILEVSIHKALISLLRN